MSVKKIILPVLVLILVIISVQNAFSEGFSNKKPAEIKLSGKRDLNRLIRLKLIIDHVNNGIVRAYISPDEFTLLENSGFKPRWLPRQLKKTKSPSKEGELSYPTYDELTNQMKTIAALYPDICHIESCGESVLKKKLWWIKISDNVDREEFEPEVHYISSMHGDEPPGTVICMELINYLTANYGSNPRINRLVDNTEIWIMPLMNPDGYEAGDERKRMNANGADLNRSFPDPSPESPDAFNATEGREPEVIAIMDWSFKHSPVLSANFHTGALVINYPFDYTRVLCPDNELFEYISLQYSMSNDPMKNTPNPSLATNGIVQGYEWYQTKGGMQDWAYLATGGNQVTIELSSDKEPPVSTLSGLWVDNRESMLAYLESVHCGVKGIVTDQDANPLSAWIRVDEIDHCVYTDPDLGDYHRMLLPGNYRIIVRAKGYSSYSQNITIEEGLVSELNVRLEKGEDPSDDSGINWPVKNSGDVTANETSGDKSSGCFILTAAE